MTRLYAIILGTMLLKGAIAQPTHIKTNWKAHWIGNEAQSVPNSFTKYRRNFSLENIPKQAIASIACDSKYWLYLNGQLVVFEGQLKRGPTPTDTYYDEVNLLPYLKPGKNTLAILVWFWGRDGFCHKNSGKTGLLFELDLGSEQESVLSGQDWKMAPHLAYQNSLSPYPNYRLPEHNIRYDARLDNEHWIQPTFDDQSWQNAKVLAKAGDAPWNKLWKRPFGLWKDSGLKQYENKPEVLNGEIRMKLPLNLTITPYFKIEAPAGLLIDIRTDNYYGGSEPNVRTEYITKAGVQEFEGLAYINGHEVIYRFPPQVKIIELAYRETRFNTNYVGYFKSDDAFLDKLWQKSLNTMNVNMRDAIQDPDRERAQWWGDAVIILEEIFYSCDSTAYPAIAKAISNLLEWQKPDGVLYSPIPAGNWDKELPAQMLAAIGKYGIGKYLLHSGDTSMIRYVYPFVKKYMSLWQLDERGLVKHRVGGWDWHDWGSQIDVPVLDNAWYYLALENCQMMSEFLGLLEDSQHYRQQAQTLRMSFQQHFWKGNRFASGNYKYFADDRANGLAVCAGLANPDQWHQLRPVLDTTFKAGPYLEKYILEAYFIMNDATAGLHRMKKRYKAMVQHPTISTLWEGWAVGSATYGGGSYNHGWSGGPLSLLSGYVAGIQPTSMGYATYQVRPQLATLTHISCQSATPKGIFQFTLKKEPQRQSLKIQTLNAIGNIAIPKPSHFVPHYLKINQQVVWQNGKSKHKKNGLVLVSEDSTYWYFECNRKQTVDIEILAKLR
ncbi:MAG: alpha-L-rhamnosidase N-terminal domain-containing protein [Runella sp.]